MATAASPIRSEADLKNPSVVKVVWGERRQALYFSRSVIPFVRDNDLADAACVNSPSPGSDAARGGALHWRHVGIYAYRKTFLNRLVRTPPCLLERAEKLEQLRALHIGARIAVLEAEEAGIGVDTPEDVQYVEKAMERR